MATKIHPSAVVDSAARLGENVEVGPNAVIEADTVIGDDCRLMAGAIVLRYTTLGCGNVVHSYAVLGGEPQDYGFEADQRSYLRIGDRNVFREGVTISRATGAGNATVVGDENLLMTGTHLGHNARIGSHCILTNSAALAGHASLGDRVILSACVGVHQFCWVGEQVMCRGLSAVTMHVPPFVLLGSSGGIIGLNRVGLRRAAHISDTDRGQIAQAFKLTYRSKLSLAGAVAAMEAHTEWGSAAGKFRDFVRRVLEAEPPYRRGLCGLRRR